ncbi:MAG: hypothetical protein MRY83_14940 [Flavobacteriales bacterium]|nr:hypothetical protein [Flavobacteriales bacterium]
MNLIETEIALINKALDWINEENRLDRKGQIIHQLFFNKESDRQTALNVLKPLGYFDIYIDILVDKDQKLYWADIMFDIKVCEKEIKASFNNLNTLIKDIPFDHNNFYLQVEFENYIVHHYDPLLDKSSSNI